VAVQGALTLLFTIYSPVMHRMDRCAAESRPRATELLHLSGMAVLFLFNAIITFLPIYFGVETAKALVESLPSWLMEGLTVAGGIMPAIGFAMLLTVMLKKQYVAFLLAGFAIVTYSDISLLGLAILALAFALYDYYRGESPPKEGKTSGI